MDITLKNNKMQGTLICVTAETKNKKLVFVAQTATWNKKRFDNDYTEIKIKPSEFSAWYQTKIAEGWTLYQD